MRLTPHRLRLAALSACIALLSVVAHVSADEYSMNDMSQRVMAATVMVHIEYESPHENRVSWGSGFIVGDGLIMTNAHVVTDSTPTRIFVHNGYLPVTEARVVAIRYDPDGKGMSGSNYYDVALLSYATPTNIRLPILPFALNMTPSQSVYAFGYPNQLQNGSRQRPGSDPILESPMVVTDGRVKQVIRSNPNLVMHDALCMYGNSGGPLVNSRGEVVGMQTWSAEPDRRNIVESFAIGSHGLTSFMQSNGFRPYIAR